MGLSIHTVVLDCGDLDRLARFWRDVTGYEIQHSSKRYRFLRDPAGRGAELILQKVPEQKTTKNRVHFDVYAIDPEAEAARVTKLGATRLDAVKDWIVMADPEGNEFCICRTDASG